MVGQSHSGLERPYGGRGEPSGTGAHSLRLRGTGVALLRYTEAKSKEDWTGGPQGEGLRAFPKRQKNNERLNLHGRVP